MALDKSLLSLKNIFICNYYLPPDGSELQQNRYKYKMSEYHCKHLDLKKQSRNDFQYANILRKTNSMTKY